MYIIQIQKKQLLRIGSTGNNYANNEYEYQYKEECIEHPMFECCKNVIAKINRMKVKYPEIGPTYYHYKGGRYQVITMSNDSETKEPVVVYKSLLFGSIVNRSLKSWNEEVQINDGKKVPRFTMYPYQND